VIEISGKQEFLNQENKYDKRRTAAIRPGQLAFLPTGEMSPDISPCEPVTERDKKKALILPYFFLKERVLFVLFYKFIEYNS
jgi:hypothetical protein